MTFFIRSRDKPVTGVQIISTGLGEALFLEDSIPDEGASSGEAASTSLGSKSSAEGECIGSPGHWAPCLLLVSVDGAVRRIRVRIPASLLPASGTSAEGRIVILAPGEQRVEVPVKVQHPGSVLSTTFFGITIPALLSFLLGYLASVLTGKRNERQKQKGLFSRYKDRNYKDLEEFFTVRYATLLTSKGQRTGQFGRELYEVLRDRSILRVIPTRERRRLQNSIRRGSTESVQQELAKAFSEWADAIRKPRNQKE
jgi:hypothetical protein